MQNCFWWADQFCCDRLSLIFESKVCTIQVGLVRACEVYFQLEEPVSVSRACALGLLSWGGPCTGPRFKFCLYYQLFLYKPIQLFCQLHVAISLVSYFISQLLQIVIPKQQMSQLLNSKILLICVPTMRFSYVPFLCTVQREILAWCKFQWFWRVVRILLKQKLPI